MPNMAIGVVTKCSSNHGPGSHSRQLDTQLLQSTVDSMCVVRLPSPGTTSHPAAPCSPICGPVIVMPVSMLRLGAAVRRGRATVTVWLAFTKPAQVPECAEKPYSGTESVSTQSAWTG